ncbi:hypothetical protein WEI85_30990 [Actinomycetes bacterium KLBMP 9797]
MSTRLGYRAVAAVLATALAAVLASPPAAARPAARPAGPVVEVAGTSAGFTVTGRSRPGHVTLAASTTHPAGALFTLVRLRPGAALDEVLANLNRGINGDRADSVAGGLEVQRLAVLPGSAAVLPGTPVSVTAYLTRGTYYVVNLQDLHEGGVPQAAARLHALTVAGTPSAAPPPRPGAGCVFVRGQGWAAFTVPDAVRSGDPIRMVNAMPQLGEAVILPVRPGTTRQHLWEFFEAANRGDWSVEMPFTGGPVGLPVVSPGYTTTVALTLAPGEYAVTTWYPNFADGTMLAAQGQFDLLTVLP